METPVTTAAMSPRPAFHYAGFWKRFLAYILDQIIMGVLVIIIIVAFIIIIGSSIWSNNFEFSSDIIIRVLTILSLMILLLLPAEWLYFALMESIKGATLGKMALGIKVTDMYGNNITFGRASGRYFGKILSSLTIGIGYIMAGITAQKQALHDMIASCLVINK